MHIKRGVRGASCADSMKTLALLCVVGLVVASDAISGRIAIYGELTLQRLVTGTLPFGRVLSIVGAQFFRMGLML